MGLIYTRTSSRKKQLKTKPNKEQREAQQAFKELQAKLDSLPKFGDKYKNVGRKARKGVTVQRAEVERIDLKPKPGKLHQGSTAKPETKVYTGTKVLGVATMHKSNAVPIFSEEEAIEVSTMRRN